MYLFLFSPIPGSPQFLSSVTHYSHCCYSKYGYGAPGKPSIPLVLFQHHNVLAHLNDHRPPVVLLPTPPNACHHVDDNSVGLIMLRADLHDFYIEVEFLGDDSDWTSDRKEVFKDAADR